MSDETTSADGLAAMIEQLRETAGRSAPGPWEWSDCFDPESDSCGLLQVRVPSLAAWDVDGWQYITIGDMEWVESREFNTAQHIAAHDPTTMLRVWDVVAAAERRRAAIADRSSTGKVMFDTQHGYAEWLRAGDRWGQSENALADALDRLHDHLCARRSDERSATDG